jgi:hypothetical protein
VEDEACDHFGGFLGDAVLLTVEREPHGVLLRISETVKAEGKGGGVSCGRAHATAFSARSKRPSKQGLGQGYAEGPGAFADVLGEEGPPPHIPCRAHLDRPDEILRGGAAVGGRAGWLPGASTSSRTWVLSILRGASTSSRVPSAASIRLTSSMWYTPWACPKGRLRGQPPPMGLVLLGGACPPRSS